MIMFLECWLILSIFAFLVDLLWCIWMFTDDDEAFKVCDFQLPSGTNNNFWIDKFGTDVEVLRSNILLNEEAVWRASTLQDYYLIEFLHNNLAWRKSDAKM